MRKQRGIVDGGLLSGALIVAIVSGIYAMLQPSTGTYQALTDRNGVIVRMDTRTGEAVPCEMRGLHLVCEARKEAKAQ